MTFRDIKNKLFGNKESKELDASVTDYVPAPEPHTSPVSSEGNETSRIYSEHLQNSLLNQVVLSTEGDFNFRIIAFAGGITIIVTSFLTIILHLVHFEIFQLFISVYTIMFGVLVCVLEGTFLPINDQLVIIRSALCSFLPILRYLWGRGSLYAFTGTLQLSQRSAMNIFSGMFLVAVGIFFVVVGAKTHRKLSIFRTCLKDERVLRREFNRFDRDKDGTLNKSEFGQLMISMTGGNIDQDELDAAFVMIDMNGNENISVDELKIWWENFDKEVEGMIAPMV